MRAAIALLLLTFSACASSSSEATAQACKTSEECPISAPCCGVDAHGAYACKAPNPAAYVCICASASACGASSCCSSLPFGSTLRGCYEKSDAADHCP